MISINPSCTSDYTAALGWRKPFHDERKFWLSEQVAPIEATLENIADAIEFYEWSPCVFMNGHRRSVNFIEASYIGLDFDEGMKLQWALDHFAPYAAIIGTTRHHQIEKVQSTGKVLPACDRFRVIVRLQEKITDLETMKATLSFYVNRHGSDRACTDAARKFRPCKEILYIGPEDGQTFMPAPKKKPRTYSRPTEAVGGIFDVKGPALQRLFSGDGRKSGGRNAAIYDASYAIFGQMPHLHADDIFPLICQYTDLPEAETLRTIKSAEKGFRG